MKTIQTLLAGVSLITVGAFAAPINTGAFADEDIVLASQSAAQTVISRAIKAAGGLEALNTLRNGKLVVSSRGARIGQGPTPDADSVLGNPGKTITYRAGGRMALENYNGENVGFRYVSGTAPADWVYQPGPNTVADIEPEVVAGILTRANTSAHILLDLVDRSASARNGGRVTEGERQYNIIHYADASGRQQTLYFDAQNGHLVKMESVSAHAHWGDTLTTITFGDHKKVGDAIVSHKITTQIGDVVAGETVVDEVSFAAVDEALFTKPEGAGENPPFRAASNTPRDLTVEELASDIYFIANAAQGYNVVFVNDDDGILVLETPQTPQASRDVIRTIGEKFPGKKIKMAVPTHHHFDHSGGIYGYLEAGVPILTTPGNADFVKNVGAAERNVGASSGAIENAVVNTFASEKTIGSGTREVKLFNVGPNPHAEEIIVAYIPAVKALFVADIYSFRGNNVVPANANQLAFAEKLETLNLDIETFIPVHGGKATAEQFWESVRLGRERAQN